MCSCCTQALHAASLSLLQHLLSPVSEPRWPVSLPACSDCLSPAWPTPLPLSHSPATPPAAARQSLPVLLHTLSVTRSGLEAHYPDVLAPLSGSNDPLYLHNQYRTYNHAPAMAWSSTLAVGVSLQHHRHKARHTSSNACPCRGAAATAPQLLGSTALSNPLPTHQFCYLLPACHVSS
jgi:hypothetical protein